MVRLPTGDRKDKSINNQFCSRDNGIDALRDNAVKISEFPAMRITKS
ncbi:hypothetical protein HMPREF0758_3585 [Serratia odorifera DSM 4582]|uniref:Uncharacterized protein n=1 Tax=Serratia odorifera DSM 4582 TaxID=667129 RepID=D4E5Y5_SEROD|nr:hypothetical protein HMPREF0758_3585 [Serratia odorifera DSM 4582]